jgi:hypothetical protein
MKNCQNAIFESEPEETRQKNVRGSPFPSGVALSSVHVESTILAQTPKIYPRRRVLLETARED